MMNTKRIAFALVALVLVFAVSCDGAAPTPKHTHAVGKKHAAVASTCTAKGSVEWYECVDETCTEKLDAEANVLETIEVDVNPTAHAKGTDHAAVGGTCQTKGTLAYWECANGCTAKLDADGNVLESIEGELDPINHESTSTYAVDYNVLNHKVYTSCCDSEVTTEHHTTAVGTCSACGHVFD